MPDGDGFADEIAEIKRILTDRGDSDKVRERAFDQLYTELQQYKDDFIFKAEKPLLLDLLLLFDSMNWFQQSLVKQEASPEVIADNFQYLIDELVEVLYRRDVVPVEPNEAFDPKIHRALQVVPTDDPALEHRVDRVLKRGFARGERVLRPEEVAVYRAKKT